MEERPQPRGRLGRGGRLQHRPSGLRLGALVRIQGRVKEYRERSQCVVNALQLCADPNVESLFWLDHARLGEEIERGQTVGR